MSIIWIAWWLLIFASFAVLEGYALNTNRMTLSRWVWTTSKAFPLLPFIVGFVIGVLACHFFWGGITSFESLS